MAARLNTVVLDCPDPKALASFYSSLLDLPITRADEGWVEVGGGRVGVPKLSFQLSPEHVTPDWPDPARPQQVHLDIRVDDIAVAHEQVLAMGARVLSDKGTGFRVYADPAGHPFCLEFG